MQTKTGRDKSVSEITRMKACRTGSEVQEQDLDQRRRHREMRTQRLSKQYIGEIPISTSPWSEDQETIPDPFSLSAKEEKDENSDEGKGEGKDQDRGEDFSDDEKDSKCDQKASSHRDQKSSKGKK
jgi:hypothetical protein